MLRVVPAFLLCCLLAAVAWPVTSRAEKNDDDFMPPVVNKSWKAECGSCHVAFPPGLLPASTWLELMQRLDKHFGNNASLDASTSQDITRYLVKYAGKARPSSGGQSSLRISEMRWFIHEHDDIPQSMWKSPAVKSPANCGACHPGAEKGNFDEDQVRLPR